jgi:hypothetical protein
MISKPKLTIDKFSGMSNEGGTFYLDGFSVENENGVQSLDEAYRVYEELNNNDTNFTNLSNIKAISYIYGLPNSNIGTSSPLRIITTGGKFFASYSGGISNYEGEIGGIASGGGYLYSQQPDIFELNSGNILYTGAYHAGLMIRGKVDAGSDTTKIIDADGRDLSALGASTITPNNKVTNLSTGEQYTITSITTTNSTNDTLNFAAGVTNSENDEFVVFVNTKFTLGTTTQFQGQQRNVYWGRPIRQYGDQYMIANGNYIALIANDEETFDATYKQLPAGYQMLTFETGAMEQILVSAYDKKGNNYLLLWDGFSNGWNEIIPVVRAPQTLKAYGSGWIFMADGIIYITDGRSIQKLIAHPDANSSTKINTAHHNSIEILGDDIYFAIGTSNSQRQTRGVLIYNMNTGLHFFKTKENGRGFAQPQCIYVNNKISITSLYSTNSRRLEIANSNSLNSISSGGNSTNSSDFKSIVYYIDFKQDTQVKEVWLNIRNTMRRYFDNRDNKNTIISVNYGNGNAPIIKYGSISDNTTTTMTNPNGAYYPGVVGEEVEVLGGSYPSEVAGERTFIQSIADAGTSSEVWTVSPALSSSTETTSELRVWSVKNGETKTITLDDLSSPVKFDTNFIGSKMWLEIVVRGTTNSFPISIDNIQLF